MFCLVTDLMDWEDYPAPELAALYKWRWDGSETALREAKAPLRGAGPGTGPMLRSGSPDLVRQELAAWAAGTGMTRGVVLDAALAAAPARKGTPRRAHGPAPRPVLRPRPPGGPVRDPPRARLLPGRDQRNRAIPERRRPGPAPRPQVQVPLVLRARGTRGHRHPHRPRRHHHGQHPSLTSGNTANPPERDPRRTVDPAATARHAGLRHARRKETTRSNQKQELPTTGQTAKAHGIASMPVRACFSYTTAQDDGLGVSPRCPHLVDRGTGAVHRNPEMGSLRDGPHRIHAAQADRNGMFHRHVQRAGFRQSPARGDQPRDLRDRGT